MYSSKEKTYRILVISLLIPILFLASLCGFEAYHLSNERVALKKDYAVVNNIQYGLLSVDRWRDDITDLVSEQIDKFKLNHQQEAAVRESLNELLNKLIDQGVEMMNQKQKTIGGKLKKLAFNTFINVDDYRKKVPEFSQTILDEIKNPKTKHTLKVIANDKLDEFAEQTHENQKEQSAFDKVLEKYHAKSLEDLNINLTTRTDELQSKIYRNVFDILGCMFLFLLTWVLIRKRPFLYRPVFVMSVILAFIVLFVSITVPMIEIDARIKEVNFMLLNKSILFHDQVIFFQSKSIFDVAHILLITKKADSILVGFLILIFSILFPIAKLISTEIFLLGKEKWKNNRLMHFFVFKSGKWTMADVMVVAIFMAFIGFKGILSSQLEGLNIQTDSIKSITTNHTSLQPGFILFVSFVLCSLLLSEGLKRISKRYVGTEKRHTD